MGTNEPEILFPSTLYRCNSCGSEYMEGQIEERGESGFICPNCPEGEEASFNEVGERIFLSLMHYLNPEDSITGLTGLFETLARDVQCLRNQGYSLTQNDGKSLIFTRYTNSE